MRYVLSLALLALTPWLWGAEPLVVKAERSQSVAESGVPRGGRLAVGHAAESYAYFQGEARTYLSFRLPELPVGERLSRAVLRVQFAFVASEANPPTITAVVLEGAPGAELTWADQPPVENAKIAAEAKGGGKELVLDLSSALAGRAGGEEIHLCLKAAGSGRRFGWWTDKGAAVLHVESDALAQVLPTTTREQPSLMPDWRKLEHAPILHYQWPAHTDAEQRQKRLDDYLAMGFTGIYKLDGEESHAGKLFKEKGMHGLMRQTRFLGRGDAVIDSAGNAIPIKHPYHKSVLSARNAEAYFGRIAAFAQNYGLENLFYCGDTIVMSSWDETGLYSRRYIDYGYGAKEKFIDYLRTRIYRDAGPGEDSNGDGWSFNRETGLDLASWDELELPAWEDRYAHPGLWKLWIDFHGYYTYLFFRMGGETVSSAIEAPVELFCFSHATVKWPGATSQRGLDLYWQSKLNRILTVEDCQWDYPGSTIFYAFTNQLSRRYQLPVLGWSWFSPDVQRARDPKQIARALARAMGHDTHGLLMWVYNDKEWREKSEARSEMARWHHTYQVHWPFLREATVPAPAVAVVFPRNTGNYYANFEYPKLDYGWICQALSEAQIPFEVIADNQVEQEPEILKDYRVLLMPSTTWQSTRVRESIAAFIADGGYAYTNADSFMLDVTDGTTTDFLAQHFGVRPQRKFKGTVSPTQDSPAEAEWARGEPAKLPEPVWEGTEDRSRFRADDEKVVAAVIEESQVEQLRANLPTTSGSGLPQTLWDPRQPQMIRSEGAEWVPAPYRTYHDIVVGDVQRGASVVASYGTEPCAVETERTLWTGFRPGFDHATLFPVITMRQFGEPIWPFEITEAKTAADREGPRRWITRIVEKAGVTRPVEVTLEGKLAANVELLRREAGGNQLIWLINHEERPGTYKVTGSALTGESAAELLGDQPLVRDADGGYSVKLDGHRVAILAVGTPSFVQERLAAQRRVPKEIPPMPEYAEATGE